ncbi:MAG: hypothetical protein AAGA85_03160 [Bacteroidota bacterium]
MAIEEAFSSSFGRRDQGPNRALAKDIVTRQDFEAITELFEVLARKSSVRVHNDAVLTIAAISSEAPQMLTAHVSELMQLLKANINRQVFGAMIALANLSSLVPEQMSEHLGLIMASMDKGTVVTRDHGFTILTQIYKVDKSGDLLPLILEQLMKAPPNQIGQYTEKFISVMDYTHRDELSAVLQERLNELDAPNHQARIRKSLLKISKT